eukprot:TRINITY_DN25895_c0_g1_i1.p1 TRINITY_DN25895_c0_g1~~TRINITY_DN25895_c0_g1_i1.p1  ORF type:complete len:395 (+),score=61.42 TRINITY_DN25895_c0_g1_i1:107-1291(+)
MRLHHLFPAVCEADGHVEAAGRNLDDAQAPASFAIEDAASHAWSAKRQSLAAFLAGPRHEQPAQFDTASLGGCRSHRTILKRVTPSAFWGLSTELEDHPAPSSRSNPELLLTAKLERKPRIRLLFQTPEIYKTDIGEQAKVARLGWKYACRFSPDEDGIGERGFLHPEIIFNGKAPMLGGMKKVHVHLEDKETGQVFWDADFDLKPFDFLYSLTGKVRIPSIQQPSLETVSFKKPCVPRDDPTTHFFDLSIRNGGQYMDKVLKEWRPMLGFSKGRGTLAHIGFEVQRFPVIGYDGHPVRGRWEGPGDNHAAGGPLSLVSDVHNERVKEGQEDPFYDQLTGKSHHGYYDHILKRTARSRNKFEFYEKNSPPLLIAKDPEFEEAMGLGGHASSAFR